MQGRANLDVNVELNIGFVLEMKHNLSCRMLKWISLNKVKFLAVGENPVGVEQQNLKTLNTDFGNRCV